jgi:hypothetical protein
MPGRGQKPALAEPTNAQRGEAMARFGVLQPYLRAFAEFEGPCCGNERRQTWIPLAMKDASADGGQSCHLNNRPRSSVWSLKVARRPLMPRGFSRFIPPLSHGCWRERPTPRPRMLNSVVPLLGLGQQETGIALASSQQVEFQFNWPLIGPAQLRNANTLHQTAARRNGMKGGPEPILRPHRHVCCGFIF